MLSQVLHEAGYTRDSWLLLNDFIKVHLCFKGVEYRTISDFYLLLEGERYVNEKDWKYVIIKKTRFMFLGIILMCEIF